MLVPMFETMRTIGFLKSFEIKEMERGAIDFDFKEAQGRCR